MNSRYGRMLFDARGRAIYLFTREPGSKSRCYGDCAVAWPPVYTRGRRTEPGIQALPGGERIRVGRLVRSKIGRKWDLDLFSYSSHFLTIRGLAGVSRFRHTPLLLKLRIFNS